MIKAFLFLLGPLFVAACAGWSAADPAQTVSTPDWTSTSWEGEPAWTAVHDGIAAIVSVTRSRLVFLGPENDHGQNLIHATKLPAGEYGSHRVWLGPQTLWGWPAPKDWEASAAEKVEARQGTLVLQLPRTDPRYPQLTRTYAWDHDALRCGVSWEGTQTPYYAMQIIQIPLPAPCRCRLRPSPDLPLGYVFVANNTTAQTTFAPPATGVKISGDQAEIAPKEPSVKVGFVPQPIVAQEGDWTVTLARGEIQGQVTSQPDFGCLTQIWTGSPEVGYFEAEQFSPYLKPAGSSPASFSISISVQRSSGK